MITLYGSTRGRHGVVAAFAMGIVAFTAGHLAAQPTFDSGSTGANGAFTTCTPPCMHVEPLPDSGIFNFTTVDIPAGVTVTFARNAANTPVTILASGNVNIEGNIDVSGQSATLDCRPGGGTPDRPCKGLLPGRGGPGGFDGSPGDALVDGHGTPGLGPGGGQGGLLFGGPGATLLGGAGSFGTNGFNAFGDSRYGSSALVPLVGGSGGGGGTDQDDTPGGGGAGGGGALLIAASGTITLNGTLSSNGGEGGDVTGLGGGVCSGGGGSGGAIRLVATRLVGTGSLLTNGGGTYGGHTLLGRGGLGRVRLEAIDVASSFAIAGVWTAGAPRPLTPPADSPTVTITSVTSVDNITIAGPEIPQGTFNTPPDIVLSPFPMNPVIVNLAATNVPVDILLSVTVKSEASFQPSTVRSEPLVGTLARSTATASLTLPAGVSVISATAEFPAP